MPNLSISTTTLLLAYSILLLSGCGGGSSGDGVSSGNTNGVVALGNNIHGTAATGAAMSGVEFYVTKLDDSPVTNGRTDVNGLYQLSLDSKQAPYIISVKNEDKTYLSLILRSDFASTSSSGSSSSNINVTPLTDVITKIAIGQAGKNSSVATLESAREDAANAVYEAVSPIFSAFKVSLGPMGILKNEFVPNVNGVDRVYDAFSTTCDKDACVLNLSDNRAQSKAFANTGGSPLKIDISNISLAAASAKNVASVLSQSGITSDMANTAPVVLVFKAVDKWDTGYTGQLTIHNFTSRSIDGGTKITFYSSKLRAKNWWNVNSTSKNGEFRLNLPAWGSIPPLSSSSNALPYSIGFNGTDSSEITDGSNCKIGGQACLVLFDDGSSAINLTEAKSTLSAADYAAVVTRATHSWANFQVARTDDIQNAAQKPTPPLSMDSSGGALFSSGGANASAGNLPSGQPTTPASVTLSSTAHWDGGFNGALSIVNTSNENWSTWRLSFNVPEGLTNIGSWGNYVQNQSGNTITFSNMPWNANVPIGGSTQSGFSGSGTLAPIIQAAGALNCMIGFNGRGVTPCTLTAVGTSGAYVTPTPTPVAPTTNPSVTPNSAPAPIQSDCSTTLPCEPTSINAAITANQNKRVFFGYYPSWSDNWFSSVDWSGRQLSNDEVLVASKLARVPGTYTHISLSFAQPNFSWASGQKVWTGSGLNFNAAPQDIKRSIDVLHERGIKVMLAVGGATYNNWASLADEGAKGSGPIINSLKAIQSDLNLDGLEIDYEVTGASELKIQYANVIRAMKLAAGSNTLALAGWSTGSDCTSETSNSGIAACNGTSFWGGSAGRERLVFQGNNPLVNPSTIDFVNIMSYDAQTNHYDGVAAWNTYRDLFPSTTIVNIGLETAPEGWAGGMLVTNNADAQCSGSTITQDQYGRNNPGAYSVERYLEAVKSSRPNSNPRDGAMLWHILKTANLSCGNSIIASPGEITRKISTVFGLPLDIRYGWQ